MTLPQFVDKPHSRITWGLFLSAYSL